jgi:hypothetical protein
MHITADANAETTGINHSASSKISVYPNPATGRINIQGEVAQVDIYSVQGQLLLSDNRNVIDVAGLNKGFYLVSVTDKTDHKAMVRLIKN